MKKVVEEKPMTKAEQRALTARPRVISLRRERYLMKAYFFADGYVEALDTLDLALKKIDKLEKRAEELRVAFVDEARRKNVAEKYHIEWGLPLLEAARRVQHRKLTPSQQRAFAPVLRILERKTKYYARKRNRRRRLRR